MGGRARSNLEVPGCPKLVSPQSNIQDITGALLKHNEKGSRTSAGHIPHEKIVNIINDIFGAGRNQTHTFSIHQYPLSTHRLARPLSPSDHWLTTQQVVWDTDPWPIFRVRVQVGPKTPSGNSAKPLSASGPQFPHLNNKGFLSCKSRSL